MSVPRVYISARAARRLALGHPWVYRSDIEDDHGCASGDVVAVEKRHGRGGTNSLGWAFYSRDSLIVLRMISRGGEIPARAFLRDRLATAIEARRGLQGADTAGRLVFAESDGLPGLIVDRYADVVVMQTLCAGTERLKDLFADCLQESLAPRAVIERNDVAVRGLEGLDQKSGLLRGELAEPVTVEIGGLSLPVYPLQGQKTGAFLDQRENQIAAAVYARGRCLDAFCYQGWFGLQLARGGAAEVTLVDQSAQALEIARESGAANKLHVETVAANVFDFLSQRDKAGERYDMIVLDPPAFAKNKRALAGALRGYKEINLRAMRLLAAGGILVTCSCSYHLSVDMFDKLLASAATDSGRNVQVLERRGQARDHPERLGFPESRYLKCFILRVS